MNRSIAILVWCLMSVSRAHAGPEAHGPAAPAESFPSHRFRLEARQPEGVQLSFHYGLLQPVLYGGLNAAADVRWKRLIVTYSHGAALDFTPNLSSAERAAGLRAHVPFTTGGGVGVLLADELWVLVDVKYHRFDLALGDEHPSYDTLTVGGELGWRFFVWKGLFVSPVVRYWPNVWTSAPEGVPLQGGAVVHQPFTLGAGGLFANVLVGWAFQP